MKRAVIFLNGSPSDPRRILDFITNKTLILCADGGVRHAFALGLTPHAVLGDFDSLPKRAKKRLAHSPTRWIGHPQETNQYETDSELAIRFAIEHGARELFICGFWGTRLDHVFSNLIHLLSLPEKITATIIEGNQAVYLLRNRLKIHGKKGDLISLVPFSNSAEKVSIAGVKYPLKNASLPLGSTLGISNVMTENQIEVKVKKGVLLVVHTHKSV